MGKLLLAILVTMVPLQSRADFWGGDLPLLAEIVTNTLNTLNELQKQSSYWNDELDGIKDKINRIQTIADLVKPASWEKWKDPAEAITRLRAIYQTMPKEYRNEKYDAIDDELAKAMSLVARVNGESQTTFNSGKELERRGADASPAVAQKLTASGVGSLIAIEAQSQVLQSQITSLLTQMMAEANDRETRTTVSRGQSFFGFSKSLNQSGARFSAQVLGFRGER